MEPDQTDWVASAISNRLAKLDLQHRIIWLDENRWSQPFELAGILALVERYQLKLPDEEPLVFSLKGWCEDTVSRYFSRHGFSQKAMMAFDMMISSPELPKPVVSHVLTFLDATSYASASCLKALIAFVRDAALPPYVRAHAVQVLGKKGADCDVLLEFMDGDLEVRTTALHILVERQHRATIERELQKLIENEEEFRRGEVVFPRESPHAWISKIRADFAWHKLVMLRGKALQLSLPYMAGLVTDAMAAIDKLRLAQEVKRQIRIAPAEWRAAQQVRALEYERDARLQAARQDTLDSVIRRLKGTTSMIALKVWCEGPRDTPVFEHFLSQLADAYSAEIITDFVGGWPNLLEKDPQRLLDGCREAVVVMDGDRGRNLSKKGRPYSREAKMAHSLFQSRPIQLRVLQRYGTENYFSQAACEAVLDKDLSAYFPIPGFLPIKAHFVDWPNSFWRWLITALRKLIKKNVPAGKRSFYGKHLNRRVASRMTLTDRAGTDLLQILREISERAKALAQ